MPSTVFISYLHAGLPGPGRSGDALEIQRAAVDRHVRGHGRLAAEVVETGQDRPGSRWSRLQDALSLCRRGGATLLMADFGALSGNSAFLRHLSDELRRLDLRFAAADRPDASEVTLGIMAALAEAEDRWGGPCTPEAMARRREFYTRFTAEWRARPASGRAGMAALGHERTRLPAEGPVRNASAQRSRERAEDVAPILSEIRAAGTLTLEQVANALNALGVPSARGKRWYPTQVTRVEKCLAAGCDAVRLERRSFEQPLHV